MEEAVPPSRKALSEALILSEEILRNIELSQIPLAAICLKAGRLARLLNDFTHQQIFEYEASGYPSEPTGIPQPVWKLAKLSGRCYRLEKNGEIKEYAYIESVSTIEQKIRIAEASLTAARDPSISITSSNPNQSVYNPIGNRFERDELRKQISNGVSRLSARTGFVHSFVKRKYYELKFSGIAEDIFSRLRERVDGSISEFIPESARKFTAIYENMLSDNPEDWSNAVHTCRRLLQDLADAVFPAQADRTVMVGGKEKIIKLGVDNYINRLIAYIDGRQGSGRFSSVVGSHLSFIGERLDAVFQASQKGSHSTITEKEEAERYVIYTYMLVGDILSLTESTLLAEGLGNFGDVLDGDVASEEG